MFDSTDLLTYKTCLSPFTLNLTHIPDVFIHTKVNELELTVVEESREKLLNLQVRGQFSQFI